MTKNKEMLEFADKTVERAIEAACRHFNVDKEQLEIKLITRGSTGLFGLGGRRAKITACLKDDVEQGKSEAAPESEATDSVEAPEAAEVTSGTKDSEAALSDYSAPEEDSRDEEISTGAGTFDASAYAPGDEDESLPREEIQAQISDYSPDGDDQQEEGGQALAEAPEEEKAEPKAQEDSGEQETSELLSDEMLERLEKARVFTAQILDKAGLDAIVEIHTDVKEPFLEISGEDISLIIGKDGSTLDSIEYLVNLNLKRTDEKGGRRIPIDAQGYRAKREEGLRRTAEKLAYKARKTRRSVAMAPMNSRERRVVHMAVKAISGVKTHSTGDGRMRKVIITPVKKGNGGRKPHQRRNNRRG